MTKLLISKELFIESINAIQKQCEHDQKCHEAFSVILPDDYVSGYNNSFLLNQLIEILKELTFDTSSWIEYFIWDLDFGKEYKEGCITDEYENNVDLSTSDKLYDYLRK